MSDVWNFDLNEFRWHVVTPGGAPINPRSHHSAVATTFGTMVVFGGIDGDTVITNDFGLYNLANTVLHSANDGAVLVWRRQERRKVKREKKKKGLRT